MLDDSFEHDESRSENGDLRIGVYVCHCGGNISDVVDVEKVVEAAGKLPDVAIARRNTFMCSDPGQNMIAEDIHNENLNRVVVAACSPSLHELTFRQTLGRSGLNPYLYEHCNIREQVSWVTKSNPEGSTDKAIRLVAAGVAKARYLQPLEPIRVDAKSTVVVIGGGVTGLRCASDLARRGMVVTLLERSPFLGGRMAQLDRVYPTEDRARDLLRTLLDEVTQNPNITIHTLAEVTHVSGYVGNFDVKVTLHPRGVKAGLDQRSTTTAMNACPESTKNEFDHGLTKRKAIYSPYPGCYPPTPAIDWQICTRCGECANALGGDGIDLNEPSQEINVNAGALVLATGFDPYEPRHGEYGYGEYPAVITLPQLVRLLDPEGPTQGKLEYQGRAVKNVCIIHCVGSRQIEGIHEPGPDGELNRHCSRFCCTASLQAATEIRERFPEVNVYDFYQDIRTYGRGHEDYYQSASERGVMFFRYTAEEPPQVDAGGNGAPLAVRVKDTLTFSEEVEAPADLVVLATGMVPHNIPSLVESLKLPRSADGFLQEVHPKLRPVELAVNGVLIAGTCQAPMDITESCAAASAASAKTAAILSKGYIQLDPFVAQVDPELCRGEAKCVDECKATHAISMVEREIDGRSIPQAQVNPALCKGCGMCVAACPHGAIQVAGWRLRQFEAMVDALVEEYA